MDTTLIENGPIAQEIAGKVITAISENAEIGSLHIALVVLGALLHNLIELNKLRIAKKKFNFKIWLEENWLPIIMTSIALVACFIMRNELSDMLGFDMSNKMGCFFAGFTAHTLIDRLTGIGSNMVKKTEINTNLNQ